MKKKAPNQRLEAKNHFNRSYDLAVEITNLTRLERLKIPFSSRDVTQDFRFFLRKAPVSILNFCPRSPDIINLLWTHIRDIKPTKGILILTCN